MNAKPPVLKALRTFYSPEDPLEKPTIKQGSLKVSLKNDRLKLGRAYYGYFEDAVLGNLNFSSLKENLSLKPF
ncbi:MAG: hypothetical protein JJE07_13205 [Flavobacteriaceae bacterium]|nr:hypothetical protein [Flavobacteriaceae bacterium]